MCRLIFIEFVPQLELFPPVSNLHISERTDSGWSAVYYEMILTLSCIMSQNGQTHFKTLAAFAAKFLKCVWPFWDIIIH